MPKDCVPIATLPPRNHLSPAVREKIARMTPLFDGKTLNGWIQEPVAPLALAREDVLDVTGLAKRLSEQADPVSAFLCERLDAPGKAALAAALAGNTDSRKVAAPLVKSINGILSASANLDYTRLFQGVPLRPQTRALLAKNPRGPERARLGRMLLEDAYPQLLAQSPDASWRAKDGILASTGAGRGVIYTERDYSHYRLIFQVRQTAGNHFPGVLLFCQRPAPGTPGLDALGGIQFGVPSGSHWDYRPGINKSGTHFTRSLKLGCNLLEWAQVEILVNAQSGTARMAVAQPVGTCAMEILGFKDPAAGKAGPIALQMHNARLFDEYRDIRIEIDPKEDRLITVNQTH